jgi:hypothetical protein
MLLICLIISKVMVIRAGVCRVHCLGPVLVFSLQLRLNGSLRKHIVIVNRVDCSLLISRLTHFLRGAGTS